MRAKIVLVCAPEAKEAVLVWLIHEPVASTVSYTMPGDDAAFSGIRKTGSHDRGAKWKRGACVRPDIGGQIDEVVFVIGARIGVNARRIRECIFQDYE